MSFDFDFQLRHLRDMIPGNAEAEEWYHVLCDVLPKYRITTQERVVGFITQCAHESNNFRNLEENLNYSAENLIRVFSRYFGAPPRRNPAEYARRPEKLANYVYMDQFRSNAGALGNIHEGDGWRFRGRGLIQITGRNNYTSFGATIGMTAEQAADYASTKPGALESACWFWNTRNLNRFADARNVVSLSRAINGGNTGLDDRIDRWNRGMSLVKTTSVSRDDVPKSVLRLGSRGPEVFMLQRALGIRQTGIFGPQTEQAVRDFQRQHKLTVDGIVGDQTIGRLFNV